MIGVALCLGAALLATSPNSGFAQQTAEPQGAEAMLYRSPEEGGLRRWRIGPDGTALLRKSPGADAEVVQELREGDILANRGCSTSSGVIWCALKPLNGGASGFLEAARLVPAQGPDGTMPMGRDDSKRRARASDFDAQADIPCAQEQGETLGICQAAVARSGGGDATVVVRFANGFARQLYFQHGVFISASATMSGAGKDIDWRLKDGLHEIRVDDQRYELPESFVLGN